MGRAVGARVVRSAVVNTAPARTGSSGVAISVLDTAPVPDGATPGAALRNAVDLAVLADRLGYRRFWTAENHGMPGVAACAPQVVAAQVAARTGRIRTGAGGVLLPHHAPLVVAPRTTSSAGRGRSGRGCRSCSTAPAPAS